ncbi:predicted protein [Aspergillus terreus NIH2624]|uniref:Uncharacterized protein n=1 Tax=Aspergillus terreus (strain NIH 2624 / FGSC A1156) TaxID=341663 RepID=Q0C8R0_ASPTN|nr:uncharacterized protein ATEG_09924 [Aspergillus terreus NIH2624]EAU30115.1 predicted protein [Aspergillus terreus NIH2624]
MRTHHMKAFVKNIEEEDILETHGDVPDSIRDQLFAEEHHRSPQLPKTAYGRAETNISGPTDLEIPGPIEETVEEYTNWHLEQVNTENFKENIRRARDIVLENCLDLGQLHDRNIGAEFLVKEDVKIGVAYRFVSDTSKWLKQRKRKMAVNNNAV